MFCFSFSCVDLLHGNCLLNRFNFSMKILLAKINFLFWILLCYLLNMSSFCICSISWCCFDVPLFRCSSHVPLLCSIPIVSPVFRCFAGVPVFRQCSAVPPVFRRCFVFRRSVFRCSWFYSMPGKFQKCFNFKIFLHFQQQATCKVSCACKQGILLHVIPFVL